MDKKQKDTHEVVKIIYDLESKSLRQIDKQMYKNFNFDKTKNQFNNQEVVTICKILLNSFGNGIIIQ